MAKGIKLNGAVASDKFVGKYRELVMAGKSTKEIAAVLRGKQIDNVTEKDTAWVAQRATSARNGIREACKSLGITDTKVIEAKVDEVVPPLTGKTGSRNGAAKSLYEKMAEEVAASVKAASEKTADENSVE